MELLDALANKKTVCITFVDVQRKKQWYFAFDKINDVAKALSPMVGELVKMTDTTNEEEPFNYVKVVFIDEMTDEVDYDAYDNDDNTPPIGQA